MNPSYPFNPTYTAVSRAPGSPWSPGFFARFPWLGLGALFGSVLGMGACVAILVVSDGQPIRDWTLQPTVYLSIAYTLANIMLHYALTEGINVAWWRRSMNANTEVGDLHRFWDFGNSLWAAATSGRRINLPAIACIFAALAPVNGPLLQRASKVAVTGSNLAANIKVPITPEIPFGWTGYISGRGYQVSFLNGNFTPVAQKFQNKQPIDMRDTGCRGICTANVVGSGFAANCSQDTIAYDLVPQILSNGTIDVTTEAVQGVSGFLTMFEWSNGAPGNITLKVQYKNKEACTGDLIVKQCSLRAATVEYPVIIDGNQSRIALDPKSTIFDDAVSSIVRVPDARVQGPSTLGGLWLTLNNQYKSSTVIRFAGAVGYDVNTTGSTANSYAVMSANPTSANGPENDCSVSFTDPTADLLSSARELMFRTAIAAANSTAVQSVSAQQTVTHQVYDSQYLFLGLALAITAIAIICVLATFNGFWVIGRKVTMSPVEIAKAFNAPLLRNNDSNAETTALIEEVGGRSVMYGAVVDGGGLESSVAKEYAQVQVQTQGFSARRLEMTHADTVQKPRRGQTFAG
ncbi:MAG: hypothetical protein Q9160_002809 [Pyrenula sp. 1 TL-2023]